MTLSHLIQRAKRFVEISAEHCPGMCKVPMCDECERWNEACERLEVAIEAMEKENLCQSK